MTSETKIGERLIAEFERRTKAVPLGHEIKERGASTYNWRISHVKELREILTALSAPEKAGEVET